MHVYMYIYIYVSIYSYDVFLATQPNSGPHDFHDLIIVKSHAISNEHRIVEDIQRMLMDYHTKWIHKLKS